MSADGTDSSVISPSLGVDASSIDSLLGQASDVVLSLDKDSVIRSVRVNPQFTLVSNGLRHWIGRDIRDVLTRDSADKFEARILGRTTLDASTIQLNHIDGDKTEFPIDYTHTPPRKDGGMLMLGRSLQMIAETQQTLTRMHLELEKERERQRQFEIKYRLLMQHGRDPLMLVDAESGQISDASDALLAILNERREAIVGKSVNQMFEVHGHGDDVDDVLQAILASGARSATTPLRLTRATTRKNIAVTSAPYRVVGDRILMCRIATPDHLNGMSNELSSAMTAFYIASGEAIVVTNADGAILTANESFLRLSGSADPALLTGKSIEGFLSRGGIDLKIILKTLANNRQLNGYQTGVRDEFGTESKVDLSANAVEIEGDSRIIFLLRDGRNKNSSVQNSEYLTDQAARNIVDLIGGVDMKDIVSDTTEVVEKMCIEVALEMTNNNRVAAANMLGLSRQSLYVKIKKYGI